jgi:AAA domain-containing protein
MEHHGRRGEQRAKPRWGNAPVPPPKPKTYARDLTRLPRALVPLTQKKRWVLWRWELRNDKPGKWKWTKPPRQPNGAHASSSDPNTWSAYADVLDAFESIKADGIGYMLLTDDLAANDLDDCRDETTGKIHPWAQTYVDKANGAYIEISPSGTGLRIIGTSTKPAAHNKFSVTGASARAAVEVYRNVTTGRYITITGYEIGDCPELTNIDALIDEIIAEHAAKPNNVGNGADPKPEINGADRSATFQSIVWRFATRGLKAAEIEQRLRQDPSGIASKYLNPTDRLRAEVERSYGKWQRQYQKAVLLRSARASQYDMKSVDWLWLHRIAKGALNILAGLPDQGKGVTWADITARITKGAEWPAKEGQAKQGNVIIFTAEDDIERTVIPRLVAAGADLDCVEIVEMAQNEDGSERMFNLVTDLPALKTKIKEIGNVALVVIDPVAAYLGVGKVSGGSSTDVRGVLAPLTKIAEETQAAILAIMHFNKKADITNAILRVADSLAYVATSRSTYIAVEDPDNEGAHLFVKAKNNLAPSNVTALRYMIGARNVGFDKKMNKPIEAPLILWDNNPVKISATEAIEAAAGGTRGKAKDEAKNFLQSRLNLGPVPADDVYAEAKARGIAVGTLNRAKRELKIESEKEPGKIDGKWCWKLPQRG